MPEFNDTEIKELQRLLANPESLLMGVMPMIADIINTSIDTNFQEGGRYGSDNEYGGGSQKWAPSQRAIEEGGKTGLDTGRMGASIQVIPQGGTSVIISSGGVEYLPYFHYGTSRQVPRPVIVLQNEDFEEINHVIAEHVARRLGGKI